MNGNDGKYYIVAKRIISVIKALEKEGFDTRYDRGRLAYIYIKAKAEGDEKTVKLISSVLDLESEDEVEDDEHLR